MIVSDKEALARLGSPNNLMNRLRMQSSSPRANAMDLFVPSKTSAPLARNPPPFIPSNPFDKSSSSANPPEPQAVEPELVAEDVLANSGSQIKLALAHNKALDVMVNMIDAVSNKMDDIRPSQMGGIMNALARTVDNIRKEKIKMNEDRKGQNVHFHFYEPKRNEVSDYESLDV